MAQRVICAEQFGRLYAMEEGLNKMGGPGR